MRSSQAALIALTRIFSIAGCRWRRRRWFRLAGFGPLTIGICAVDLVIAVTIVIESIRAAVRSGCLASNTMRLLAISRKCQAGSVIAIKAAASFFVKTVPVTIALLIALSSLSGPALLIFTVGTVITVFVLEFEVMAVLDCAWLSVGIRVVAIVCFPDAGFSSRRRSSGGPVAITVNTILNMALQPFFAIARVRLRRVTSHACDRKFFYQIATIIYRVLTTSWVQPWNESIWVIIAVLAVISEARLSPFGNRLIS